MFFLLFSLLLIGLGSGAAGTSWRRSTFGKPSAAPAWHRQCCCTAKANGQHRSSTGKGRLRSTNVPPLSCHSLRLVFAFILSGLSKFAWPNSKLVNELHDLKAKRPGVIVYTDLRKAPLPSWMDLAAAAKADDEEKKDPLQELARSIADASRAVAEPKEPAQLRFHEWVAAYQHYMLASIAAGLAFIVRLLSLLYVRSQAAHAHLCSWKTIGSPCSASPTWRRWDLGVNSTPIYVL